MSPVTIFNTLTRRKEPLDPLQPGHVRIYSCGPTVYNFVHIGNLRTFLWGDLLRRYLEWKGFKVTQIMNLTDVDDRIIRNAREQGVDLRTYTAPYVDAFFSDIDALRIRRATSYPRATDHIGEMVDIVTKLSDHGHTYVADGSTYFRISTFPGYGKLSRIDVQTASEFNRVDSDTDDKQDARDFVLWKAKKEGEASWKTPLGEGRPGWHLECSAMSMKYLGETFDIHTGAVDLIFPHHENEIAQSEGATGKPFVRYWVHGEHLNLDQQKMSKSLGNIFTLRELLDQGYSALQVRYALLSVPHRTKLNFSLQSLDDAKHALERLALFMIRLEEREAAAEEKGADPAIAEELAAALRGEFEAAMDDDLNTARALGALFVLVRDGNIALDEGRIPPAGARSIADAIRSIDTVFDLLPESRASLDQEIERLIAERNAARARRDFAESDRLRDLLLSKGIILEDTAQGTRWRRQ